MIAKYIAIIRDVLNLILIGIAVVERPGEGEVKKQEAIKMIKETAKVILPDWAINLFLNDTTLGLLIDYLVGRLNKTNVFNHSA